MKIAVDPLLAETVPDGTFGGARTPRRERKPSKRGPDPLAARHRADLEAELCRLAKRKRLCAPESAPRDPPRPDTPTKPRTPATITRSK